MVNRFLLVVAAMLLAACSSGSIRQDLERNPSLSCVAGDLANFFKSAAGNAAHAAVKMIDGNKVGTRNSVCVEPGLHYVTVGVAKNWIVGEGYMEISMEAGRTYKLHAELEGPTFLITLVEVSSDGEERQIKQQQVSARGH